MLVQPVSSQRPSCTSLRLHMLHATYCACSPCRGIVKGGAALASRQAHLVCTCERSGSPALAQKLRSLYDAAAGQLARGDAHLLPHLSRVTSMQHACRERAVTMSPHLAAVCLKAAHGANLLASHRVHQADIGVVEWRLRAGRPSGTLQVASCLSSRGHQASAGTPQQPQRRQDSRLSA